jgi:hypothetical protein
MKKLFAIVAISMLSSTAFADSRSHEEHFGTDGDAYGSLLNETLDPGIRATSPGQQGEQDGEVIYGQLLICINLQVIAPEGFFLAQLLANTSDFMY